ncbi:PREDICTED: uncharacterized protein LOC105151008 [Acromyrmex echinatior]|uniref:uncharacterized protein LOC105151008 n=1 Tax=Acromyrmex echinatior TaxID=103372 RepID=UPI000580DA77|nr:PREDICTED: uncharacterized protein LOC105151008 [Acromyrmex echinatior]
MNYGRLCTMIVCGVNFSLGWILIASSYNVIQLFIGRMLTGIAMGICAAYVGIYLAEISITSWKTVITIIPNIALITGILIVYLLGFVLQDQHNNRSIFDHCNSRNNSTSIVITACCSKRLLFIIQKKVEEGLLLSLQLLLLYCIVVQSYATHEDGFTSTELKTKSEVSKGTTTSANTRIIDQNSNKSSQSDQGKDFFFSIGPKANPIGHIKISNNTFSELKEWLSKLLPINWENTKQDSLKEITPDNNDSSKETSDKILSDKTESPLHPKDDSPIEEVASTIFPEIENPVKQRIHTESHFVWYLFGRPIITHYSKHFTEQKDKKNFSQLPLEN